MAREDDLRIIEQQERELVFDRFDDERAVKLGIEAHALALTEQLGVSIDIRLWNRPI